MILSTKCLVFKCPSNITGEKVSGDVTDLSFTDFLIGVGEYFDVENLRVCAVQKDFKLSDRVKLDEALYAW